MHNQMNPFIISFLACIASYLLTRSVRYYAKRQNIIDVPNDRSSHEQPTPRGGGISIVIVFLSAIVLLGNAWDIQSNYGYALTGACAWVALLGFIDDHKHVAAPIRLFGHIIAGCWVMYWLEGIPILAVYRDSAQSAWLSYALGVIYIVWLTNVYNFMDGIDGLAGIEGITVCAGGVLLYFLGTHVDPDWRILLLLSCSTLGFLFLNFPQASIFMGDAGSGFMGVALGVLSIRAGMIDSAIFWGWLILLGVFIVDTNMTLVRRFIRRENIFEAHRTHAYQFAARKYSSHVKVSMAIGAINLLWLLPISILVVLGWLQGFIGMCLAYAPLVLLGWYLNAGAKELQEKMP